MSLRTPHRVDEIELGAFFFHHEIEAASATTADGTQRKRLIRRGAGTYVVQRRYLMGPKLDQDWATIYTGENLVSAVDAYNRLS